MREFIYIFWLVVYSVLCAVSCGELPRSKPSASLRPGSPVAPDFPDTIPQVIQPRPSPTTTTPAGAPPAAWQEPSVALKDLEQAFADKNKYTASYAQINGRYKLEDTLKGASGSHIYDVSLKSDPKERRVFKVLYEIAPGEKLWDHFGFKEIYFSQRLSELTHNAMLPNDVQASIFFPKFYGFGFVHSENPFKNHDASNNFYPYYVMERISGLALQDFALKPDLSQKTLGYRIDNAPDGAIFSIIFQISLALLNAELEFGFLHNDIHPKNIFLSTTPIDIIVDAFDTKVKLTGPMVKIIDFDQGEMPDHPPAPYRAGKNKGRMVGGVVGEERAFFFAVNPQASLKTWAGLVLRCNRIAPSIDIYMVNILLHTFRTYFLDHGVEVSGRYFKTHSGILDFLRLNAHKFGLASS